MFNAYDLKKIIPRAVFALVAVNLSWGLIEIFIKAVEVIGDGAQGLIMAPFVDAGLTGIQLGGNSNFAFTAIIAGAAGAALIGIIPVVGVAVSGLFGLLFAFGIIMLRKIMLIGLIIISPVAIALSVFPQTESWAKKWWDWFSKLMLMYPFIMAFFGISEVAAGIISRTSAGTEFQELIYKLGAVVILIIPYFLVGKALTLAGGAIGKVAGMVNNKDKGIIDRTKKWEAGKVAERRVDAKAGARYSDNRFTRPINRALRRGMNPRETLSFSESSRGAAMVRAQEAALAARAKAHPELENLTDDEAELLSTGSKAKAKARSVEMVRRAVEGGENEAAAQRRIDLALATAEQKAGGFDSISAQAALPKAVKAGRVGSHEIDGLAADIVHGVAGNGNQQQTLKEQIIKNAETGFKESSSVLHAQLATRDPSSGARTITPGIASVIDAKDDRGRATALSGLSESDQATLHKTVDATFDGSGKVTMDRVGAMDSGSRKTVIASKQKRVETVVAGLAAGTISSDAAATELAKHRTDILTLAQASTNSNNGAGATEANAALTAIDDTLNRYGSSAVSMTPGRSLSVQDIQTASGVMFQNRMGSAGHRQSGPPTP